MDPRRRWPSDRARFGNRVGKMRRTTSGGIAHEVPAETVGPTERRSGQQRCARPHGQCPSMRWSWPEDPRPWVGWKTSSSRPTTEAPPRLSMSTPRRVRHRAREHRAGDHLLGWSDQDHRRRPRKQPVDHRRSGLRSWATRTTVMAVPGPPSPPDRPSWPAGRRRRLANGFVEEQQAGPTDQGLGQQQPAAARRPTAHRSGVRA